MKILAAILFMFLTGSAFAQTTFTVDNFSKDYYGKIRISDTAEVFSQGSVAIYDSKTKKQIIIVESEELALSLHEGKAFANIRSLPYGEQSLIMYEDFNFDGRKDFAISDGQHSCYHGPSFQIYLAAGIGFTYSKEFTRLAQDYCGMFNAEAKEKKIYTMTKSGCCSHEFSEFIVVNNKPKAIKIETEEMEMPFITVTTEIWNGQSMAKTVKRKIDIGEADVILSFNIPKNGKQVILFNMNDRLYYALVQKDSTVEFSYPWKQLMKARTSSLKILQPMQQLHLKIKMLYIRYMNSQKKLGSPYLPKAKHIIGPATRLQKKVAWKRWEK